MNRAIIVIPVQTPIVFKESRVCSTAPVLTSSLCPAFSMASKLQRRHDLQIFNETCPKIMKQYYTKETQNIDTYANECQSESFTLLKIRASAR